MHPRFHSSLIAPPEVIPTVTADCSSSVTGRSHNACFCAAPAFSLAEAKKESAAQAQGRRYEEKALPFLVAWARGHGYSPIVKPWVEYRDTLGRVRYCQPDFLAVAEDSDNLLLIEIKLRHTRDAFTQFDLYKPLIREIFPKNHIIPVELCRYFDLSEFKCELLPGLRPHPFPHAAVLWEPLPPPPFMQ